MTHDYQPRTYRNLIQSTSVAPFQVRVKETDLWIHAADGCEQYARELVIECRSHIESFIRSNPEFLEALHPLKINGPAPLIVRQMAEAAGKAGVGPMAAVAGAVAEYVGSGLLSLSDEVIVENGGDIFLQKKDEVILGIFAGSSPLSMKIGIRITSNNSPLAVCTSSGTIGHSVSFGKADAVCVVSTSCSLADAAATSVANRVKSKNDIRPAIEFGKQIQNIKGILIIFGDAVGAWGEIDIFPLNGKKG